MAAGLRSESKLLPRHLAFPDHGIHLRHHFLGEQLHRAPPEIAVLPVLSGQQQRTEIPDLLAESEDLIGDAIGRAPENELLASGIERYLVVRLIGPGLESNCAAAALELGEKLAVIITIRPVRIV